VFRTICKQAGLHVIKQEVIPWGSTVFIDCLTTFCFLPQTRTEYIYIENSAFRSEQRNSKIIASIYGLPQNREVSSESELTSAEVIRETLHGIPYVFEYFSLWKHIKYLTKRILKLIIRLLQKSE
jgi:hypothetical protein